MPSTYSPLLRLELLGAGEQSGLWGDTTNKNIGQLLEQAIAGVTTVSLSGGAGDYTLSALDGTYDESRSAVLKFIGNPSGTKNIIIPTETKLYVVRNDCGQTITVKTAAQVTGVTLLNGEASLVFCDGTNAIAGIATAGVGPTTVANGGTGATSFTGGFVKSPGGTGTLTSSATVNAATELSGTVGVGNGGTGATTFGAGFLKTAGGTAAFTASGISLSADVSGTLPVANGGTGQTSLAANNVLLGNGTSGLLSVAPGTSGNVLTSNGSTWISQAPAGGGAVTSFNGRTGAVVPQGGDYSSFYASTTGSNVTAGSTWGINISGSAPWGNITSKPTTLTGYGITDAVDLSNNQTIGGTKTFSNTISGTINNANSLGTVAAANYAQLATTQTFTGNKTFTGQLVVGTPVSVGTAPSITSTAYNFTSNTSIFTTGGTDVQIFVQGNQRFRLDSSGNLNISGTLTQGSDPRLKDDIQDYTKGLDDLQNIRVRSWTYNGKGGTTKGRKAIGVVATEIEAYMPEMIINAEGKLNPEDTQTTTIKNVDSLQMTWLLVKSVQELKAEVDALKAQLAAK